MGPCAVAMAVSCGGSGGGGTFSPGGSDSGGVTSDGGGTGDDASFGDDVTTLDSGGVLAESSLLDIQFPDAFFGPEAGDGGGTPDAGGDGATCSPAGVTCQGNTAYTCSNGTLTVTDCTQLTPAQTCANGYGCVVCQPGTGSCSGNTGSQCKPDGSGYTTNVCDPLLGESCNPSNGQCAGDCANLGASYIGCEYYAVTMSNSALDQATFYFSVSLSNTSSKTANINITGPNATNVSDTIPAGTLKEYRLGWVPSLSTNQTTTLVAGGAYHIRTTEPVTAYQFNARDYQIGSTYSYTNDASLLIPVNAMTGTYRVVAGATWYFPAGGTQYPGNVDIIGTVDGTKVTYATPGGNPIQAAVGLSATGGTVTLNHGDVLQIAATKNASSGVFGSDQTGGSVSATQPVEVFGGVDCTYMPASVQACDHIEEINFPVETLRGDYLVTLPNNTNGAPQQYVKIVGTQNGTTLTYDPPQAGAPASLGAGQSSFFHSTSHFHVVASHPVLVGQFMESEQNFAQTATSGDPALSAAVATGQFRGSYQFVAPANYQQNWVNVIAPAGAQVSVDGTAVGGFAAIGSSGYGVAYVPLCANNSCSGVHTASGNVAFGIEVYGYGSYTSYMYPGGLNLARQ
ncbi:MAG TPA: IgGFc-binding protein [Polyangiaceae bacterium]